MTYTDPTLRARDEVVIANLLAGKTMGEVAKAAGMGRKTLYRLRHDPAFQKKFVEAKEELLSSAVGMLHSYAADFIVTLHKVAMDEKAYANARALAADRGLQALFRCRELDFTARIEALEKIIAEQATPAEIDAEAWTPTPPNGSPPLPLEGRDARAEGDV
jgi:hypothetical protein